MPFRAVFGIARVKQGYPLSQVPQSSKASLAAQAKSFLRENGWLTLPLETSWTLPRGSPGAQMPAENMVLRQAGSSSRLCPELTRQPPITAGASGRISGQLIIVLQLADYRILPSLNILDNNNI
jgi:hypothetical protein